MSNYQGVRCPVCDKKFAGNDDIVVCPVCGAPHHRDCYKSRGECAFQSEHLTGKEWRAPEPKPTPEEEADGARICSRCNAANPPNGVYCTVCGHPLSQGDPMGGSHDSGPWQEYQPAYDTSFYIYGGLSPDESLGEEMTAREMAAYIGPSSGYYLPRFKRMIEQKRSVSVNFSAFFFQFFYFFYRKMYVIGGVLLALFLLRMIPAFLYVKEALPILVVNMGWEELFAQAGFVLSPAVDMAKVAYYESMNRYAHLGSLAIGVVASLCANRLYYDQSVRHVQRIRRQAEESGMEPARYQYTLTMAGGCNRWMPILLAVGLYIVTFIISGYLIIGG